MKHLSHENKRTFGKCSKQIDELLEGFTPETREAVLRGLVDKSKLPEGWKSKGTEDVCIFNNNRRGFNSKKQSVQEDIVDKLQPDVINLEETLLRNKAKINTKEYVSFSQNRADGAGGGGISTSVAAHLKQYATLVSQNNQHDEYMITRLEHVKPALNIVHIYGQNEGRSGPEKVLKGWTEILKELSSIEERNEVALLVGDMNRAIGNDELGVRGNSRKVSYGGQLVRDLVSAGDYVLLNNLELTRGGPWTWVCPGTGRVSCLDLALASRALLPFVKEVLVDSERKYAPRRVVTKGKNLGLHFADHFPLVIKLEMPKAETIPDKDVGWNLGKPGAWEEYAKVSEEEAEHVQELAENEFITNEQLMNKLDKLQNKIKYKTFGKTKPKTKNKVAKESKVTEALEEKANDVAKRQSERLMNEITKVKEMKTGRCGKIFRMKDVITGPKKTGKEAHAIRNPKTGDLVVSNTEIKKVTLEYCKSVLKNNEPEEDMKELVELKEKLHQIEMETKDEDEEEFVVEEEAFFQAIRKFKSTGSKAYDFITKSGISFQKGVLKVCRRFIRDEVFPERFKNTDLVQLPKKGSPLVLDNSRFVHVKEAWPRLVEQLTVGGMKDDILAAGTRYQIGGCPGQRTQFHLFVAKSIMGIKIHFGGGGIFNLYDFQNFFDKQNIVDAMESLTRAKVKRKLYRVWFKLNITKIRVRTGAGYTEEAEVGAVTAQGAGGSALISSLNLDLGVNDFFAGSVDEDFYGRVRLQPHIWCDDILRSANNINSVRVGNIKLDTMRKQKQLSFHPEKSVYLLYGNPKLQESMRNEIRMEPITLGSIRVKEVLEESYLGDRLSSLGLAASVEATVKDREGKIKGSIYELKAVVEDIRMQCVGGMRSALDLYSSCILSSLLTNCGTWTEIKDETIKKLDHLQNTFLRAVLQVPVSTPVLALRASTGLLGMKWIIWKEKILLVMAIRRQEEEGLARTVLEEQISMGWPGLAQEVSKIRKQLGLPDACKEDVDKTEVAEAIVFNHMKVLKEEMEVKAPKKLKKLREKDFRKCQPYCELTLSECRMGFRLDCYMLDCRSNMKKRYKNDLICRACDPGPGAAGVGVGTEVGAEAEVGARSEETQEHLLFCVGYAHLHQGLDVYGERDRIRYYLRVQNEREEMGYGL